MSTIPHEHVHRVFTSMYITPTYKIIALQCNESSTPKFTSYLEREQDCSEISTLNYFLYKEITEFLY
jgi:hypothetical protein